jgi:hypothetical protein
MITGKYIEWTLKMSDPFMIALDLSARENLGLVAVLEGH